MNFKNMYILCRSLEQRDRVYDVLKQWGYRHVGIWDDGDHDLIVATYTDGDFSAVAEWKHTHTFDEFMAYYDNALVNKIRFVKIWLQLSNRKLSGELGYAQNYITRILNKLPRENVQQRLLRELDDYLRPHLVIENFPHVERRNKLEKISAGVLVVIILVLVVCLVGLLS